MAAHNSRFRVQSYTGDSEWLQPVEVFLFRGYQKVGQTRHLGPNRYCPTTLATLQTNADRLFLSPETRTLAASEGCPSSPLLLWVESAFDSALSGFSGAVVPLLEQGVGDDDPRLALALRNVSGRLKTASEEEKQAVMDWLEDSGMREQVPETLKTSPRCFWASLAVAEEAATRERYPVASGSQSRAQPPFRISLASSRISGCFA